MKAKVLQMTKEILMRGLQKSRFDLLNTSLSASGLGLFTSQEDKNNAFRIACKFLVIWQDQARNGNNPLPSTREEVERFIDIHLADFSFMGSATLINNPFFVESNAELVKEARDAIDLLRSLGGDAAEKASVFEWILKKRIGEE
jgi:hypothetical protein